MFVKVDGANPSLFEILNNSNGLEYGSTVTYEPPWEIIWADKLNLAFRFCHYRGGKIPPHQVPAGMPELVTPDPYWVAYWVWWADPDKGIYGVVSTDPIYILNDNGKTIDRVT